MPEVSISINGKSYGITCDTGQEGRVADLGSYIDNRLRQIMSAGAAKSDAHLLVLTSLVLADELFDAKSGGQAPATAPISAPSEDNSKEIAEVIDMLTSRIEDIASRVEEAA